MSKDMLGEKTLEALRRSRSGLLRDLAQKLASPNKDEYLRILKRAMRKESPWVSADDFPVWRTITMKPLPPSLYRYELGGHCSHEMERVMPQLVKEVKSRWSPGRTELDLVRVSCRQLGIVRRGWNSDEEDFFVRALQCGLYPCPEGAALALRDSYDDQPMGEWLWMGMHSLAAEGRKYVFVVANMAGDLLLTADNPTSTSSDIILVKPRKEKQ
jgi:hypothetical protein